MTHARFTVTVRDDAGQSRQITEAQRDFLLGKGLLEKDPALVAGQVPCYLATTGKLDDLDVVILRQALEHYSPALAHDALVAAFPGAADLPELSQLPPSAEEILQQVSEIAGRLLALPNNERAARLASLHKEHARLADAVELALAGMQLGRHL